MFAPAPARKPLTAATSPGRSAQRSKSRPTSLVLNPCVPAPGYSSSTRFRVSLTGHAARQIGTCGATGKILAFVAHEGHTPATVTVETGNPSFLTAIYPVGPRVHRPTPSRIMETHPGDSE